MTTVVDYSHFLRTADDGAVMMDFAVENITCADCILKIEKTLALLPGVEKARVNYSNRRLHVEWTKGQCDPVDFIDALDGIGYHAYPFSLATLADADARHMQFLLRCLAVAAFGAMNIMLLSISVWAGDATTINSETRDFFHLISAVIALPVAAFAGQPFFFSALRALRGRSVNMDVPISLGILLALGMSVYETLHHAEHAYFDSAVMLLTFLLLGRVMDEAMRGKTRERASNLAAFRSRFATRQMPDETLVEVPAGTLVADDLVLVRVGERVPADGVVLQGNSDVDESPITGETAHRSIAVGDAVHAGSLNYSGHLLVKVTRAGDSTLLSDIERLMENAMMAKARIMRLADRVARLYAPVVHLTALTSAIAWLALGAGVHDAIIIAITVLIITCPCALALAVPAVQVAASGAMFRTGLLLNSGDAIERFAVVDTIIFDKTGTLTLPDPQIVNAEDIPQDLWALAVRLAQTSHHPLARILAQSDSTALPLPQAQETPGQGVCALFEGQEARLGSSSFCDAHVEVASAQSLDPLASRLVVRYGAQKAVFLIRQTLRADAAACVQQLRRDGYKILIYSGDRPEAVAPVARQLGVDDWAGALTPAEKLQRLNALNAAGAKVLMVGDGINDAPALAAAYASMSPITATDLAQSCADAVFLGRHLGPIEEGLTLSRRALGLMRENLGLSVIYNLIALPLAVIGWVTPLIAALAMSGSSILVTLNALRAQSKRLRKPIE